MTNVKRVVVSIASFNTCALLRDCLASLTPSEQGVEHDVEVIDNGSVDGSPDMVAREFPWARLIRNETNVGFARAHNQVAVDDYDYWLVLNSDTTVARGAISTLVEFMDSHPAAALASAAVNSVEGLRQRSAFAEPRLWRAALRALGLCAVLPRGLRDRVLGYYASSEVSREVGWVWATAVIARVESVREIGRLDESFFCYGEDIEWCLRVRRHGQQVWFVPPAQVRHHDGGTSSRMWSRETVLARKWDGVYAALDAHRSPLEVWLWQAIELARFARECVNATLRRNAARAVDARTGVRYHIRALRSGLRPRRRDASVAVEGLTPLGQLDDFAGESITPICISGQSLIVVRIANRVHVLDGVCTHLGAALAEGEIIDDAVECASHFARFNVYTGSADRPARKPLRVYPAVVRDGVLLAKMQGVNGTKPAAR